jgi:DNA (cytosine-5)-methyltransferase 1
MKIGSLCSGVGLLDLGLEWAGLGETVWHVEINPFSRRILRKHWKHSRIYDDVKLVGGKSPRIILEPVDLICFGSPCQDISSAGKQAGLSGARSGLFYECARVVEEICPEWVVVENVASGAKLWVDDVRRELQRIGYASLPVPIEARDVGALHRRARIFIVAHSDRGRERSLARLAEVAGAQEASGARLPSDAGGERQQAGILEREPDAQRRAIADGGDRRQAAADALGEAVGQPASGQRVDRKGRRRVDDSSSGAAAADVDRLALWVNEQRNARRGEGVRDERDPIAGFPGWFGPEPEVVQLVYGSPGGLDGRGPLSARRSAALLAEDDLNSKKREALSNSVVPWCSEVVGYVIQQLRLEASAAE